MRVYSARMGITYLVTAIIAIVAVYGVMQYWYGSILTMHKHRLEDIVYNRKNSILSTYIQQLKTLQISQEEAFESSIETLKDSFRVYQKSGLSNEFIIIAKEKGAYYSLYKNLNGQPFPLKEPLADQSEHQVVTHAFRGASGVNEDVNEYGVKLVTAYDYLDMGDHRIVLLASVPYSEISKPKYAAIFSAVVICLVVLGSGGFIFYVLSKKNFEDIRSADKQRETFEYIMDSVKELVSYIDVKGRYVAVNDAYQSIFGVAKEQVIGMHIREFHGEHRYNDHLKGCIETCLSGKAVKHQIWYDFMGGYRRFFDMSFVPHYIDGKINGVIITANDITELEMAKLELLERTRDLKKLTMELEQKVREETAKRLQHEQLFFEQKKFADMGQMINAIAHQWRQPINALGLYIQYIVESVMEEQVTAERLEEFKADSIGLVQHLSKTIDDFRGFFEPSKNKTEFQVIGAVTETVSLVDAQLKSHFIEYTVSCQCAHKNFLSCNDTSHPPCEHPMTLVAGYPSEFKQVMMNLIQNAKDALEYKSIDKKLAVNIAASDNDITVTVCDNGGGIPDKILGNIFDPYFTTKKEGKGTGIGLYMSKLIIEDHMDGKLTAYNNKEGACFEIRLTKLVPASKQ
jgi:PAS domain S-box-containing protein